MTLGERIRELREEKRFTQSELAKEANVDFTYISKLENNKIVKGRGPGSEVIKRISKALFNSISYEPLYEELMLLAEKIPETYEKAILDNKEVFLRSYQKDTRSLFNLIKHTIDRKKGN